MVAVGTGGAGGFLLWKDLSPSSLRALEEATDEPSLLTTLAPILRTADIDDPLKREGAAHRGGERRGWEG